MGNTDSTQKLGERVLVAKRKLEQNKEIQSQRYEYLQQNCPDMLLAAMESTEASFKSYSPFLEPTLLLAWIYDEERCKNVVLKTCRKVLSSPINKEEYSWFREYVFESSLWFFKSQKNDTFMYEDLLNIAKEMSKDIMDSMDSIYKHLQTHEKWKKVMAIKDESIVARQDHPKVGLFQTNGFKDLFESKANDEKSEEMKGFVDSNIAINILTSTATNINREFQHHIDAVMSYHGKVQKGPIKNVERCVSKLENDYQSAAYPKAAKLLDLVRCSVTFNTVDQMMDGYTALIKHISKNKNIELARVKNGFLDETRSGYRDIKLNVIYKSDIDIGTNIICEIQLLLINYLQEKKRIHKLYSIVREQLYFEMVTTEQDQTEMKTKDVKDLQFQSCLNAAKQVKSGLFQEQRNVYKCSMNPKLDLLAIEGKRMFDCVNIQTKEVIFQQQTENGWNLHSHNWFSKNEQHYLSLQTARNTIKIFEVHEGCKFKENESLTISLGDKDVIYFSEFDRNYDNIFMVYNGSRLQKRSMKNVNRVLLNIELEQKVKTSKKKQLALSNNGNICVIGGGTDHEYFYLIDIQSNKQFKLTSNTLKHTKSPSFINGETEYFAICGEDQLEIWDIEKKQCIKNISIDGAGSLRCSTSIHNILAIGSGDKMLRLFDVRTWEVFYSQKYEMAPQSLHLTEDLQYLAIGGNKGEICTVLKIQ